MYVLRTTLYTNPDLPMCVVVREGDVESFGDILDARPTDTFLTHEIFEVPDDSDIVQVTAHALARLTDAVLCHERNMAISFFWHTQTLASVLPGGTVANTQTSPLSAQEILQVFAQIAKHPNYNRHTVMSFAEDMTPVQLVNGEVRIGE